jgi:hypothetical protein
LPIFVRSEAERADEMWRQRASSSMHAPLHGCRLFSGDGGNTRIGQNARVSCVKADARPLAMTEPRDAPHARNRDGDFQPGD